MPWARHDAGFTRSFEDQVVRHEGDCGTVWV